MFLMRQSPSSWRDPSLIHSPSPLRLVRWIQQSWKHLGVVHYRYHYYLFDLASNGSDMSSLAVNDHVPFLQNQRPQQTARLQILCFHHVFVDGSHWLTTMLVLYMAWKPGHGQSILGLQRNPADYWNFCAYKAPSQDWFHNSQLQQLS